MAALRAAEITRLHCGYFVAPDDHPEAGQPLPSTGFVIRHPQGMILFDTGFGPLDDDARERYRPRIRRATDALTEAGIDPQEVTAIVNCHLHFDHAGGNHHFPGVPIYVQRFELEAARQPDYTFPAYACDFPNARLEVISGAHDLLPGVRIVPTPGHTDGHQSLLLETDIGVVMLAGQASDTAGRFSTEAYAQRLDVELADPIGEYPQWMADLRAAREWNVRRALFAHDTLVWERDDSTLGHPQRG